LERVWISAQHESGTSNQILVAFGEDADEKADIYDGRKRSDSKVLSFYMPVTDFKKGMESEKLAIQGLPTFEQGRVVELGVEAKQAGSFTFSLSKLDNIEETQEIYLYDSQTGIETDLKTSNYITDLEVGEFNERFELRFIGEKITSIGDELMQTGISVFSYENQIQVDFTDAELANANIAIYDLTGRLVLTHSNKSKLQANFELPNSGIFIVKVENAKGILTKKLYLD
jgi:hypothetical protein